MSSPVPGHLFDDWRPPLLIVLAMACAPACGPAGSDAGTDTATDSSTDTGTDTGTDATLYPDAGDVDAWMPPADTTDHGPPVDTPGFVFGPTFRVTEVQVLGEGGMDLDGDGIPDNALAALPFGTEALSDFFTQGLIDGTITLLIELRDPDLRIGATFRVFFYRGVSTKDGIVLDPTSLDGDGIPRVAATAFAGARNEVPHVVVRLPSMPPDVILFDLVHARMGLDLGAPTYAAPPVNPTSLDATLGAVLQACTLAQFGDVLFGTESLFDLLVGLGMQPDFDLSGDGLESAELAPGLPPTVGSCIDGDMSEIPSFAERPCACDPRIEDGYSLGIRLATVPEVITGIAP